VLAAVAIGTYFNISTGKIKTALESYSPSNSRSQLIEKESNKIILDAYNANPSSMKAAIENFQKINATNKILILGAMAELGDESLYEHEQIIDLITKYNWSDVVLVGGDFLKIKGDFKKFDNSLKAREWYKSQKFENAYLLIKGSRSMQMERVLD
jgi:UDP-N-acetylmuramoyl-tripeptide--D-alanyl-D-alanine ligase